MFGATPEHFFFTSAPSFEKLSFAHLLLHSKARYFSHHTSYSWDLAFFIITRWGKYFPSVKVFWSRSGSLLSSSCSIELRFSAAERLLGNMTYPDDVKLK